MNPENLSVPVVTVLLAVIFTGSLCTKQKTESDTHEERAATPSATVAATKDTLAVEPAIVDSSERTDRAKTAENDSAAAATDSAPPPKKKHHIGSITNLDNLNAILEGTPGKLLVFDLYADWCVPCKILAPLYDSLAVKHGELADFYRVDVQRNPDIAAAFGVQGIPFVVFMKNREIVHAITGLNPPESYERVITTCGGTASVKECRENLNKPL